MSEGAEDESAAASGGTERVGEAETVGGIGEVPRPPKEQSASEEGGRGEGVSSDELRTSMEGVEVGGEDMDDGEEAGVE